MARLGVEAGEPQGAAHREEQHDRPAEHVQFRHRPQIEHRRGSDPEADEVGQAVELGAKARGRFEEARHPPVEPVKDPGGDDREHRTLEIPVHRIAHRRHPGAQRQQGQDVRHHAVDRQAGEPPRPDPRPAAHPARPHPQAPPAGIVELVHCATPWRGGSCASRSASTVSPPIIRCPATTIGM